MSARRLAIAILLAAAPAAAEDKITVALYAPNAPFDSGEARYSFASRLTQQIQSVTGLTAEPKAFARASDFEAAVKKNQVDFAIVDGVYLAGRGVPYNVIAIATAGGETAGRWSLWASEASGVLALQGKRLSFVTSGGKDAAFIDNALLDGELTKHFGTRSSAPDVASAVAAVSLHKADCVFAPDAAGGPLRRVFDAGRVPNPAFVVVKSGLAPDVIERVKKAVIGHSSASGTAGYDGWKAGSPEPYRALGSRMAPKSRRPVMTEPDAVPLDDNDVLVPQPLEPAAPDLKDQFWSPTGVP